MSESRGITILGSTGTIGVNTLDVLSRHPHDYHVIALTANTGVERLYRQCLQYKPRYAAMVDEDSATQLSEKLKVHGSDTQVLSGI
ncbi:MAG: 1-deoxy-D-xylulose-5-phosphate reductoisomerase, partial [Gammaproteobacteria bacterium]